MHDLAELELTYAPPFSSAKDPVNMAGYLAQNVLSGLTEVAAPKDLELYDPERHILLDVRTVAEYDQGHIEGARHLPVDDLRSRIGELDSEKEIWAYCAVGMRGYIASRILQQRGFRVKNITGGYRSYSMSKFVPS
ncbi:rhodanese-like domain-containing protein [Cohnella sp.]|uniref:rhodanese-like domain-containing protein n=1 Tax=Cohnella sp. TaxID=1883426 RepID=UPI00356AE146